jgi:chromosome segregation ATPase
MPNYKIVNGHFYEFPAELYHHGVKGMRWGVRRSRARLSGRVDKLTNKNQKLSDKASDLDKKVKEYDAKSSRMISQNSKYEARISKATAKKAKYDVKLAKEMSKKRIDADKVGKYTAKSAKYNLKINKAKKKLVYNKWAVKSQEAKQTAIKTRDKIAKNENMKRVYNNTIKAMDANKIEQGRVFMQYVTG